MEGKNYHKKLKCRHLYIMEGRKEISMIFDTWQQIKEQESRKRA